MNRSCMLALLFVCTLSLPAQAQRPNTRNGFWIGFGAGVGSHGQSAASADADRTTDLSGYFRLGGTVSQNLLLGLDVTAWTQFFSGDSTTVGFLGPAVMFYPSTNGSFYLKGSIGMLALSTEEETSSGTSGRGFALGLELGNDFRVARNFSLVVFLNAIGSTGVERKVFGVPTGIDVNPNIIQLGFGVGWH